MTVRRLAIYVAALLALALVAYGLVLWALFACAPAPLPGDEMWTWRQNAGEALALILRSGSAACFTGDPAAAMTLVAGAWTLRVLIVGAIAIPLWEVVGRELRLAWFRARGGHVLLAGMFEDIAGLARAHGRLAGTFYLAPDRAAAADIARSRPFAEIATFGRRSLPAQMTRLGSRAAKLVAATTRNDLVNSAIAESVLDNPGKGEMLLRLEQPAVRALSSHRLRRRASGLGRDLAVVSLTQMQTRQGLAVAMPGRFRIESDPRVHIALCGTGDGLQAAAVEIARQGYGLERERPLLSIIRTGSIDFGPGMLERLQASEVVETRVAIAPAGDAAMLDRVLSGTVLDNPPLRAIHCLGATPEEAEALARRWEEVLLTLGQAIPPIVAYAAEDRPLGTTGMIRVAAAPDLADARKVAQLMDARAVAVHNLFLAAQKQARGDAFGTAPAEVGWADLPENFRDDNRAVADQMDFKLAKVFMLSRPGSGSAPLTDADIGTLAPLAHARWWAARAMSGWKHGDHRDDRAMLHPDMIPYEALNEAAKQKDRDEVASLAEMARLAGEGLRRERRVAIARPPGSNELSALLSNLSSSSPEEVAVAVLPLDGAEMVALAHTLLERGIAIDAIIRPTAYALDGIDSVLRRAWRIEVIANA